MKLERLPMPDLRETRWRPGPETHWESWSRNGEACISGLNPPFVGGARLASSLTWLVRSFASHCRRTHDATAALAFTCTGPQMPSTLALTMAVSFDLALRDLRLVRERVSRRGGDPTACRWPTFWLEGSAYEYVIGREPFPPVGTPRRRLILLGEERQLFAPAQAAKLSTRIRNAWASDLDSIAGIDGGAIARLLKQDEHAFGLSMLVLVRP